MFALFLFCAVIGGTFLACQIVMTLVGIGGDSHMDVSGHMGDVGDLHLDVGGDVGHGGVDHGGGNADGHYDSTSAFKIISFRTVIAGLAFFGLGGLGADATDATPIVVWAVALGSGAAAMYLVYWIFHTLYSLNSDGTVHISNAVGRHGTVYLRVPGHESGTGKIQLNLQSRTAEYLAMTAGPELPTGTKIVVVDVLTSSTVQVEPVQEPERSDHE